MVAQICHPPADWSCLTESEIDALDSVKKERAEAFAWSLLASLTAYQIGVCPVTIRPCSARCAPAGSIPYAITGRGSGAALGVGRIGMLNPYISGGRWYNACGCGPRDCSCESLPTVLLPGPVGGIVSVSLDGVTLPSSAYRVYDGNQLVRTDGQDWPACQDMSVGEGVTGYSSFEGAYGTTGIYEFTRVGDVVTVRVVPDAAVGLVGTPLPDRFRPATYQAVAQNADARVTVQDLADVGTFLITHQGTGETPLTFSYVGAPAEPDVVAPGGGFVVTYYRGSPPNVMTTYAAGLLANEFYQACEGGECRLPGNVTRASRGGESYEFETSDFPEGKTDIPEVNAVIRYYNPFGQRVPTTVASPDTVGTGGRVPSWRR